ncbi:hypothetical protein ABZT03_16745 [Streptomyces sp. NPDC005574]|uniref:hypothetical protein n=1 Tax=Streptomyces sp. NPDC005574 TaxID=3156891 RepID=UPI0033ABE573
MSEHTPSQAEGERDEPDTGHTGHPSPPHPTPSQAEGDREDTQGDGTDADGQK